jgi:hypothetical protein
MSSWGDGRLEKAHTLWRHAGPTRGQARQWGLYGALLLYLLAVPAAPGAMVGIERLSLPPLDLEIPVAGSSPGVNADGRFGVFVSFDEIYLWDRQTGKAALVSVAVSGLPRRGSSSSPAISADGRFIAFASDAANLVPGDQNGHWDVFVAERE